MPEWQHTDGRPGDDRQELDTELVKLAQEGDTDAFGQLYERYSPAVFRFLFSHIDNRLDAEDLTEDVFIRIWRSLPGYRHQGIPFVAYVFRVARNRLIDYYRRSKRNKDQVSLDDIVIGDHQADPGDIVDNGLEHQEIQALLGDLRDDYRMVLTLRFMGDLSPDETAEVMGRTSGAVRVLQHRALAALRKMLGD